jgi:tetratricopeptide (TPR) repeat protein
MPAVSMEKLVLAALDSGSVADTDPARGRSLSALTEAVSGRGQRLSQRVTIAVTIETLTDKGLLRRETIDGEERLVPTEEGIERAASARQELVTTEIQLVDGETRRELPIRDAAAELDRSPVALAAEAASEGVYHRRDREPAEGLVGRDDEQETLTKVLERVREDRQGEAVIVHGPSGIGKTTFVDEILGNAPSGVDVVRARCPEAGEEPYQSLREALALLDPDPDPFVATGLEARDADTYEAQQAALFHDVTELLSPDSGARVLFLDDVDMADTATWSYLEYLGERLSEHPILVLVTHRPGMLPDDARIVSGENGPPMARIELTGLDPHETQRLIEQVLDRAGVPGEFVDAVHERTDGNPLFVKTTVETLLERDQLDPQFRWYPDDADAIDLPDAVRETVTEQIGLLDEDSREILEWVGIAGEPVPPGVLESVASVSGQRVVAIVDTLVDAGVLDRIREHDRVTIRNTVVREALVEGIEPAELERRHGTLAETLAGTVVDGDPRQAPHNADGAATIATHYEQAGEAEAAIEWYEEGAERATGVYAHETAIDQYHRVLEVARSADMAERVLSTGQRLAEIYQTISEYEQASRHVQFVRERTPESDTTRRRRNARLAAEIAVRRGEYGTAVTEATDALDLSDDPDREQCRLLAVKTDAELYQGDYERATETSKQLRSLAEQLDASEIEAEAVRKLGKIARRQSEYDHAHECYREALETYREVDDRHGEADALNSLGIVADHQSDPETAREYYERALGAYREVGDRHQAAKVLQNLANIDNKRENYDQAMEAYEEALETADSVGDPSLVGTIRMNLGVTAAQRAEYDQGREYVRGALETLESVGQPRPAAVARATLGAILVETGEYDAAREYLRDAVETLAEMGDRFHEAGARSELGRIACHRGAYDRAEKYYGTAFEAAEEVGNQMITAGVRAGQGRLCYRREEYDRAREHCLAACESLPDGHGERSDPLQTLGLVAIDRGEFDRSREHLDAAIAVTESPHRVAQARAAIGRLELRTGNPGQAGDILCEAVETFDRIGTVHDAARGRYLLGRVAAETGDHATARERWERALDTFTDIGAVPDALQALEALVSLDRDQGNPDAALEWCDRALSLIETSDATTDREPWFREQRHELTE